MSLLCIEFIVKSFFRSINGFPVKITEKQAEFLFGIIHGLQSPGLAVIPQYQFVTVQQGFGLEAMLSSLSDSEDRPSPGTERIHRIRMYFQFHFAEHLDIEKILPGFGMSRRTFYREWGQAFAESPAEYLLKLRINEARMLLQNSSLRIYEIASECGYPNVTYFSRCFAQAIGMTPQAYRRLCRKR